MIRRLMRGGANSKESQVPNKVDEATAVFYPVAKVEKIKPGEMRYVEVGEDEEPVCLINFEGDFYALNDCCTHEDASLSDGEIVGDEIECPLHGGAFEIRTGLPANFPVVVPAKMYPVRVVDGIVEIGVQEK
jgi:nitrite reductase/ring-hydroxylating ferredoxin subunit